MDSTDVCTVHTVRPGGLRAEPYLAAGLPECRAAGRDTACFSPPGDVTQTLILDWRRYRKWGFFFFSVWAFSSSKHIPVVVITDSLYLLLLPLLLLSGHREPGKPRPKGREGGEERSGSPCNWNRFYIIH